MSDAGFEFEIETARLEQTLDNLLAVVDECIWTFRDDELFVGGIDPANAAMVHESLSPEAFEFYHAADMDIGINLQRLWDYLGELQSDTVTLGWDAELRQMSIDGEHAHINMAAIDPDNVRHQGEIPEVKDELPVVLTVESGALEHAVGLTEMVSDHLELDTDPGRENPFHVTAIGDTDDVDIDFGEAIITADYGTACVSKFSIGYVENILDPIPSDAEVLLRHGQEKPTTLEWQFAEGAADVTMMVAPRVKST